MAKAITLNDIAAINKTLSDKAKYSDAEFYQYVDLIKEYVDKTIFKNDIITERLIHYAKQSSRIVDVWTMKNDEISIDAHMVNNYLTQCKLAIEKAIYIKPEVFNFSIFVEIKSIVRFYLEKTYELESLRNYTTLYGINTMEFHQQNETFKYLYAVFDKFAYIAHHLNNKYVRKIKVNPSDASLKFFVDFCKEISFLTKNAKDYQELNDDIEMITDSSAWHYVRKLRNILEHDFTDPGSKYNITFSLNLLFIIIGRIMLSLNDHLKDEMQIREALEELKKESK